MTAESKFYLSIGELCRENGWSLDEIAALALARTATSRTQRAAFLRMLRSLSRQAEVEVHSK